MGKINILKIWELSVMEKAEERIILNIIIERLKSALLIFTVTLVLFYLFSGIDAVLEIIFGFAVGCLNFILFCIGAGFIINVRFRMGGLFQPLLFIFRYVIVFLMIAAFISVKGADILNVFAGLITVNFSVIISSFINCAAKRKEE